MQKYILGAHPNEQTAIIQPFDMQGQLGGWREANAAIVYLASEVDAVIKEAIKFMNEGHYGLAAVTLSSAINPPTSEL